MGASTGEVATFGEDKYDAILTLMMASGFKKPERNVFLCIGPLHCKLEFLPSVRAARARPHPLLLAGHVRLLQGPRATGEAASQALGAEAAQRGELPRRG